jgi:predicted outer membrane protein
MTSLTACRLLAAAAALSLLCPLLSPVEAASGDGSALVEQDRQFLYWADESAKADAAMNRLALRQARAGDIVAFARRALAADKRRVARLAALAQARRVSLPQKPDKESRSLHDDIAAVRGGAFDRVFIRNAIAEARKAMSLSEDEAASGKNAAIEGFVASALPELQRIHEAACRAELQLAGTAPLMSPSGTVATHQPSPLPMPG